jgi:glycosyltransferase involved in cell wall biosynthesis
VFGYAGALREDVSLRASAWTVAPLALLAGWRTARHVARVRRATVLHGHWVVPGGAIAAAAAGGRPLVLSLHGSDVYVAERSRPARIAARMALRRARWISACSADLADRVIALGADPAIVEVLPYGVDAERFAPRAEARAALRSRLGLQGENPTIFAAGRFVRKKGFEHLIDAFGEVARTRPGARLVLAGGGDLDAELRARAAARGIADRVTWAGVVPQTDMANYLAVADVVAVPSIRDAAGNVDGLPNVVLEALAAGKPLVATTAGGIPGVVDDGRTGILVAERDSAGLAQAIDGLLGDAALRARLGAAARAAAQQRFGWNRFAQALERAYDRAARGPLPSK